MNRVARLKDVKFWAFIFLAALLLTPVVMALGLPWLSVAFAVCYSVAWEVLRPARPSEAPVG